MFNKIIAAVIGVFGLTVIPVVSVSQAAPIIFSGLTMDVHRTNNVRVGTGDDATSLLARFN
ncbi:MAG: hypothetical protein GXP02_04160, partial [Alphaproteobacteria bacterium]|nr:hypothetical protein [Alphaproteobacteria bacterium]